MTERRQNGGCEDVNSDMSDDTPPVLNAVLPKRAASILDANGELSRCSTGHASSDDTLEERTDLHGQRDTADAIGNDSYFNELIECTNFHQGTSYQNLKVKQKQALISASKQDVLCVLPTGYGKTVIIHMLPFLVTAIDPKSCPTSIVVITPLNAILEEQRHRFGRSCLVIDGNFEEFDELASQQLARLSAGDFLYVLAHPETIMNSKVRKVLMSDLLSKKMSHIVIDEAHCVITWGASKFRPAFLQLKSLRATLGDAKVVALTATATDQLMKQLIKSLDMRNVKVIRESPDRSNIFLEVKRRPATSNGVESSYTEVLDPYLYELKDLRDNFPRTVVYLPLKWCGFMHDRANCLLGITRHQCDIEDTEILQYVAQYHAPQTSEMKQIISKSMGNPDGSVRLLFATEAYGMGADAANVRRIVHVGPPNSMETYIQEIGRAGRDGLPSTASMYANASDLALNKKHLSDTMREYCRLKSCRRNFVLEYFGFAGTTNTKCCDICVSSKEAARSEQTVEKAVVDRRIHALLEYFKLENTSGQGKALLPAISSGLCPELAREISGSVVITQQSIREKYPFISDTVVNNIEKIVSVIK